MKDMIEIGSKSYVDNIEYGNACKISHGASVFGDVDNKVILGNHVYIGPNSYIEGKHGLVQIGDNVSLARNVSIITSSGPNASPKLQRAFPLSFGDVLVENDVWIGSNSVIMPGVKIGEFSIVATNSFVNRNVDPFTIVGGSPAKIIRRMDELEVKLLTDD